jgi:hypothetical protein
MTKGMLVRAVSSLSTSTGDAVQRAATKTAVMVILFIYILGEIRVDWENFPRGKLAMLKKRFEMLGVWLWI